MANPHRGQVALAAGDATYTLCFSANALCELEDATGQAVTQITEKFNSGGASMKLVRALVWAGLQDHHPDIDLKGAGRIITDAGMAPTMEAVGRAFELAFPDVEEGGSRPPKAKAG